jgi:photosystem II stability/assembly factor-like uncharacterized protein
MSDSYLAGNGALWVQPSGPNTEPKYLGCHALGDVDEPQGDITLVYCSDPTQPNLFKVDTSFRGEPGAITTSIETLMRRTADYLEALRDGGVLYINMVDKGRKDLFTNRGRGFALDGMSVTARGGSGWAVRDPGSQDSSLMTFDVGAEALYRYYTLFSARKPSVATEDIAAIGAYGIEMPCEMIALGFLATAAASPEVYLSTDYGITFTVTAADPFAADDNIAAVSIFGLGSDTTRILLARLDDAGAVAEAAYSDDCGVTWTTAVMSGAVTDEGVLGPNGLEVIDPSHIWAVGNGGAIYFSSQGGAVWTTHAAGGVVTSANLNVVKFMDDQIGFAAGATAVVLRTLDGGIVWEDISSGVPAVGSILSCAITPSGTVWLGSDDGSLIFSSEVGLCGSGLTWTQRAYPNQGTDDVKSIEFLNDLIGWMVVEDVIYRTVNGGYDWEVVDTPANSGINDLVICDANKAWSAGALHAATAFLASTSN